MRRWRVTHRSGPADIAEALDAGWEPFAVVAGPNGRGSDSVYMRRLVEVPSPNDPRPIPQPPPAVRP